MNEESELEKRLKKELDNHGTDMVIDCLVEAIIKRAEEFKESRKEDSDNLITLANEITSAMNAAIQRQIWELFRKAKK